MSVRAGYEELGVEGYYSKHSEDYSNPHEYKVRHLIEKFVHGYGSLDGNRILDMCCGSGEVTRELLNMCSECNIEGLDPFTSSTYRKKTGQECLVYDFKDIVNGALENKRYDLIICSYAMHLCEESMLSNLLYQLSLISNTLVIITPHKRPEVKNWWKEIESYKYEGSTLKVYRSTNNER